MSLETSPVRRRALAGVLSAVLVGGLTTTVAATTPAVGSEQAGYQVLNARLRPSGDPDGTGSARFRLYPAGGKVCARVTWDRIGAPNAAHIHRASDGVVKVDLTGSVTGGKNCTTGVSKRLVRRILDNPRRFYFNVHNADYPAGAIQGTLRR
jgi:hypothetical protein